MSELESDVKIDKMLKEFFPELDISPRKRKLIQWAAGFNKLYSFIQSSSEKRGVAWIESLIELFQVRFEVHNGDYDHIPSTGPVVIISNHPTVIDGAALISTVATVRKDIKIVGNHLLNMLFPQSKDITIGIKNLNGKVSPRQVKEMNDHLKNGGVLIICPAGRIASISLKGLRESSWSSGFVQLALKNNAAIVPIHITGSNSFYYYLTALIWRPLSNFLINREIMRHRGSRLRIKICPQVMLPDLDKNEYDYAKIASDIKNQLLGQVKEESYLFPMLSPVSQPENRKLLIEALSHCEELAKLHDGKKLYLYQYKNESYSPIIYELGRLREITYRDMGAGTGNRRDNDSYDYEYNHIVLWDPAELEIVGAYRIAAAKEIIQKHGLNGLYSDSLLHYKDEFIPKLNESVELSRGFIQYHYRNTNALESLWKGVFCFLSKHSECKYLQGMLSIPNSFSQLAKDLIVCFYQLYFSDMSHNGCSPEDIFVVSDKSVVTLFSGDDLKNDWQILNDKLLEAGFKLPWPYKQAVKWFLPGGANVSCFVLNKKFNSVDGLNFCEIAKMKKIYTKHFLPKSKIEDLC